MRLKSLLTDLLPSRSPYTNIYELADPVLADAEPAHEAGRHLVRFYKGAIRHPALKLAVLGGCRHSRIPESRAQPYRMMLTRARDATPEQWADDHWVRTTFAPLARLLDEVVPARWSRREPLQGYGDSTGEDLHAVEAAVWAHVSKVWAKHSDDPYFPVNAQPVLCGDDTMTGANFLDILTGLGSWEYQNATLLFALARVYLMACPRKLALVKSSYVGQAEPLRLSPSWISHRTAFYDVIFAELLLGKLEAPGTPQDEIQKLAEMVQSLLQFVIVTSAEPLESPSSGTSHPGITCLPLDESGQPACRMSARDWRIKQDLGFADYLPDVDTTFLGLALARRWLDLTAAGKVPLDPAFRKTCEAFLDHPWVEIIAEYQHGSPTQALACTNAVTAPLDYYGAVGIWFEKPFAKDGGSLIRQALGNDMCPGHNMDILESILANRAQWNSLENGNLATVHRFLAFHRKAFESGNFTRVSAIKFYLPATYVYYAGRAWRTFRSMSEDEQHLVDPDGAFDTIREHAIAYLRHDLFAREMNPFDAALGVLALVLLEYEPRHDGLIAHGLSVLRAHLGEDARAPYRAYEWTLVRHPTRIIVGSSVSTSIFVLGACAEARAYLYGEDASGIQGEEGAL